jgi:hypothetical protein
MTTEEIINVQVSSTWADASDSNAVTLSKCNDKLELWIENDDGEGSDSFTHAQFEAMVLAARKLMGWWTTTPS